jgi:type I restriction enzyme S subunit
MLKKKIAIVPLEEQKKTALFLSLIDERIVVQNKIISAYKSLMKPLFECMNDGGGQEFCIDEIGTYYSCDSLSWDEMSSKGYPAIIYGQLFTDYSLIIQDIVGHTKKQISSKSKGNDLLFPSSTTVDSLSLISPASLSIVDISLGGDMFFIALNEGFNCDYLSLLINFEYRKQLARFAQGSTIIHLYYESIKNFKLLIAPKEIQEKIVNCEKQIIKIIDVENKLLNCLEEQKKYFLKNLFI